MLVCESMLRYQPGFPTRPSFQLVRLVGCGLIAMADNVKQKRTLHSDVVGVSKTVGVWCATTKRWMFRRM